MWGTRLKQTLFMVALTLLGSAGAFLYGPFLGFAVYLTYAVLRPQFMWEWALPQNIQWSFIVAVATMAAVVVTGPRTPRPAPGKLPPAPVAFNRAHLLFLLFGLWITLAYLVGEQSPDGADYMVLYLKIFVMYWVGWAVVRTASQMWICVLIYALSLGYIAYDVNFRYFFDGTLKIARDGYGGNDNNGAGMLLAMGVPICAFAWECYRGWYRWVFALLIPVILHAVLMTYSRGAMVALILASPFWILRGRFRKQKIILGLCVLAMVPVMAGKEISERFMSIGQGEKDESASSRLGSWMAGIRIAMFKPITGVGIRSSNLYTKAYGADMEGRTIHNQYIQLAADTGFVGAGIYIALVLSVLVGCQRVAARARPYDDPESVRVYNAACAVQAALVTFCTGAVFLSCEAFEPQYFLLFMGAQLSLIYPPGARPLPGPWAYPQVVVLPPPESPGTPVPGP
jgi:probable O-glycosylation ligase (exosortase A-associated)